MYSTQHVVGDDSPLESLYDETVRPAEPKPGSWE